MKYETVAALVEQIEALSPADLTTGLAYRLGAVIEKRQRVVSKAEELHKQFEAELTDKGYSIANGGWYSSEFVQVLAAETITWRPPLCDEFVDQPMAQITARYVDGCWQTTRMFFNHE